PTDYMHLSIFLFQAEDGIRDRNVTGVQTCALPICCLMLGLWSNTPLLIIPGMGLNAMFTYTIVQAGEFTWQEALAMVFVSGLIFVVIAFTPLEKVITSSIPNALKEAITIGIGILLILIGLENAGIVTTSEHTLITIGDISNPTVLITFVGL